MEKILSLLDKTETRKKYLFLYYILCPIFYFLDVICFFYFWNKIKNEILVNDNIIKFLDDNEFSYKWWKLYKIDIIEPDSFLDTLNLEEMQVKIKAEFTIEFTNILAQNTAFDVENYINLNVETGFVSEKKLKKYSVEIRYYRFYLVIKNIKYLFLWFLTIISLIYLLSQFINV